MRVVVTGANGFAGQHLVRALLAEGGAELVAGVYGGRDEALENEGVDVLPLDVTSRSSVLEMLREAAPERIYHLAGQASVGHSFEAPLATWEVNATGTLLLLEGVREAGLRGVRVLLISSAEVYGAVPADRQPASEDLPLRPLTPYGASKAAAEMVALQAALGGVAEVVIARSFNHIGPGQDTRFVLPSLARQLAASAASIGASDELRVGNLDVVRDFLDVRDAVRAYRIIMEQGDSGTAYNVCAGRPLCLEDVVRRMMELSGGSTRLVVDRERIRPVDIPELVGDASRLRSLGWEPRISLDRTLRDLLAAQGAEFGIPT